LGSSCFFLRFHERTGGCAVREGGVILIALYGMLLGARHALEPDHLAAVSTMAAHGSSRADVVRVSAAWGAGHAFLILVAGILLTSLGVEMPPHLAGRADTLVGLALIAVGAWTLLSVRRDRIHMHPHTHGVQPAHTHFHLHPQDAGHATHPQPPSWVRRPQTAFAIGTLHGTAGSGAAVALAVLVAPSRIVAIIYLLSFGLGSLAGMVAVGVFAMWPIIRISSRARPARQLLQGLAGVTSVVVGGLLSAGLL
jgi:sulfite exporter TauE/SafE